MDEVRIIEPANGGVERILNCLPSPEQGDDWTVDHADAAGLLKAAPLPDSVDLREAWWRVGDQRSTGSCVGWATGDSVLRWHFVQAGRIAPTDEVSPRFLWMAAKETDEFAQAPTAFIEADGTSLKAALDVARRYGGVLEAVLPMFNMNVLYPHDSRSFYVLASRLKIASYINLGRDPRAWRRWLAEQGPVLTRLDVDDAWMQAAQTRGQLRTYVRPSTPAGHAVAFVGYDSDSFIVRNSWGDTWGDKGFAYASNDYAAAAFTEAYGVAVA